jgi:DNA-binding XRE family transcriptional regulator
MTLYNNINQIFIIFKTISTIFTKHELRVIVLIKHREKRGTEMLDINSKECHIQFGKFIREAREQNKLYQWEVAEKVGVTQSYMSYIERGERDVDLVLAMKICEVLNVDIQIFIKQYIK